MARMNGERGKERDRETEGQRERQRERQKDRKRDTEGLIYQGVGACFQALIVRKD